MLEISSLRVHQYTIFFHASNVTKPLRVQEYGKWAIRANQGRPIQHPNAGTHTNRDSHPPSCITHAADTSAVSRHQTPHLHRTRDQETAKRSEAAFANLGQAFFSSILHLYLSSNRESDHSNRTTTIYSSYTARDTVLCQDTSIYHTLSCFSLPLDISFGPLDGNACSCSWRQDESGSPIMCLSSVF